MHPPSRARRILKWTGVGLSLVILAAWMLSMWFGSNLVLPSELQIGTSDGMFFFSYAPPANGLEKGVFGAAWKGFVNEPQFEGLGLRLPKYFPQNPFYVSPIYSMSIPFWLPLLLTAIPTAWLWHRDRRRIRPGHCPRCGYDLTGNTSGVCSECGLPAALGRAPAPAPEKSGR